MTFHVGQKVVFLRVGHLGQTRGEVTPTVNEVYTVRWIGRLCGILAIRLVEIRNRRHSYPDIGLRECVFDAHAFKPAASKATQLFRAIAQGITDGKPIIDDPQPQQVPLSPETIRELIGGGAIRI